jgi:hypothetical protein
MIVGIVGSGLVDVATASMDAMPHPTVRRAAKCGVPAGVVRQSGTTARMARIRRLPGSQISGCVNKNENGRTI